MFLDSCSPVQLPCEVGTYYADPCNCSSYYQCYQPYKFPLLRQCAAGTAWDDEESICDAEEKVYINDLCTPNRPWKRCERIDDVSDQELEGIRDKCLDIVTNNGGGDNLSPDTVGIVSGVLGGLLFIALIILVVILIRRWKGQKKMLSKLKRGKQPVDNLAYSADQGEIYDTIDPDTMRESASNKTDTPGVRERPLATLPYKEQLELMSQSVSNVTNHPDVRRDYINVNDAQPSCSQKETPQNSTAVEQNRAPSVYSSPYMEPPRYEDVSNYDSDTRLTPSAPEYVDFGHYDTEYSLASEPGKPQT